MTRSESNSKQKGPARSRSAPRFILLDLGEAWRKRFGESCSVTYAEGADLRVAIERASRNSLWISSRSHMTDQLLRTLSAGGGAHPARRSPIGDIFMLEPPRPRTLPILNSWFEKVIGETPSFRTLPLEELAEALSAPPQQAQELFVGGVVDTESGTLALVRANLERVSVPLSMFKSSGTHKPNFRRFELDDYGHTVRFGEYEAAADAILYEVDAEYRKRLDVKRRAEERGFGPALRRLRLQKGLSRDAFTGVSAKTLARLERGEVERPHGRTLRIISDVLKVDPDQIETF